MKLDNHCNEYHQWKEQDEINDIEEIIDNTLIKTQPLNLSQRNGLLALQL